jgi:hypothetical protein
MIVAHFSVLFAEFCGKRFTLLWHGNRDGHSHGHWPTLALIRDRERLIFRGFTPVERESRIRNQSREGGSESQEFPFPFLAEESIQFPIFICAEG